MVSKKVKVILYSVCAVSWSFWTHRSRVPTPFCQEVLLSSAVLSLSSVQATSYKAATQIYCSQWPGISASGIGLVLLITMIVNSFICPLTD